MTTEKAPKQNQRPAKPPAGYTEQSDDVVGYWDPEESGPINCTPLHCVIMDGFIDATKPATLVFVKLIDPLMVTNPQDTNELIQAKTGDLVGIWAKPGMKALGRSMGVPTYIVRNQSKDKDTGKPSLMMGFDVYTKGEGTALKVLEDRRDESRAAKTQVKTAADSKSKPANGKARLPEDDADAQDYSQGEDAIPF